MGINAFTLAAIDIMGLWLFGFGFCVVIFVLFDIIGGYLIWFERTERCQFGGVSRSSDIMHRALL